MKYPSLLFFCLLLVACCRANNNGAKIAYGTAASRGEFPGFVAVTDRNGNQFCGGTLIHPQYVITACHCVQDTTAARVAVIIDRLDLSSANTGSRINAVELFKHPQYNPSTTNNDVAIIKLQTAVSETQFVKYADLHASTAALAVGTMLWVVGYGLTEGNRVTNVVRKVELPIATSSRCARFSSFITSTMLCAGDGSKDSCPGDSGGPMGFFDPTSRIFTIAGLVSFGPATACGTQGNYGAYTRVSTFVPWIRTIVPTISRPSGSNTSTPTPARSPSTTNSTSSGGSSSGGGSTGGAKPTGPGQTNSTTGGTGTGTGGNNPGTPTPASSKPRPIVSSSSSTTTDTSNTANPQYSSFGNTTYSAANTLHMSCCLLVAFFILALATIL